MNTINISATCSIANKFLAELRDCNYQTNRALFRNNIVRIGEIMAYEISKTLSYEPKDIQTPLGICPTLLPTDEIVLATVLRAGLPMHEGMLRIFDHADCAFVSAYREYDDDNQTDVSIHVEYLASPDLTGKTLIIADPMLATGGSIELGYKAFATQGEPRQIHVASIIAAPEGVAHLESVMPKDKTTIWCAAIDERLNEHKYIIPGLGDAGDLCFGTKN